MSLIELTPLEAENLGCCFVMPVPCPIDSPEPEFIYDIESMRWTQNSECGKPRVCISPVSYARKPDRSAIRDFKAHCYRSLKATIDTLQAENERLRKELDMATSQVPP